MASQKQNSSLITLAEAAKYTPYSADYLNLLVRRGKLPAKKVGRNWYTSTKALRWYMNHRAVANGQPADHRVHQPMIGSQQVHPIKIGSHEHLLLTSTPLRWLLLVLAVFFLVLLIFPEFVFGMSSSNYRLNQSFIGAGGRQESSASYRLMETVGDIGTGNSQSSSYRLRAGFLPGIQNSTLSFTVSTTNLNLGTISASSIASNAHTMTVKTELVRGYVITAKADHTLQSGSASIGYVADGTVTAGNNEYGARFSGGSGSHPAGDIALGTLTTVTSHSDNTETGDTTTATYKASASATTPGGTYSSTTTYIATGTF